MTSRSVMLAVAAMLSFGPAVRAQDKPAFAGFSIANIAISTPDPERLANWYIDVLGFQRRESTDGGAGGAKLAFIERDGVNFDLIQFPNMRPLEAPLGPPNHLSIPRIRNVVFWVDDLPAANAQLKAKGVQLIWESFPAPWIQTSITAFNDPDGNLVALWQRRPQQPRP